MGRNEVGGAEQVLGDGVEGDLDVDFGEPVVFAGLVFLAVASKSPSTCPAARLCAVNLKDMYMCSRCCSRGQTCRLTPTKASSAESFRFVNGVDLFRSDDSCARVTRWVARFGGFG